MDTDNYLAGLTDAINMAIRECSAGEDVSGAFDYQEMREGINRLVYRNTNLRLQLSESKAQRDRAVELLREVYEAMVRYQLDVDDEPPVAHRDMMRRAGNCLAEIEEVTP